TSDPDLLTTVIEILLETQDELINDGRLKQTYSHHELAALAAKLYTTLQADQQTNHLNRQEIQQKIKFAALLSA
ncbi:MAG: hypothetical protein OEY11_14675, partial [Gammaproteobacteria bacterium]|nr:hypothetical protein [Gammaproteobacteria bacterium]